MSGGTHLRLEERERLAALKVEGLRRGFPNRLTRLAMMKMQAAWRRARMMRPCLS